MDRARDIGALRQALASLDPLDQTGQSGLVSLGADPIDSALGGGLARGAVHEIFALRTADLAAAAGFATGVTLRIENGGPLVWIRPKRAARETGFLYGHGLAQMGGAAGETILVSVDSVAQGLRAGLEAMRCAGLGAVLIELWGHSKHFDLTASRRLALAAQKNAVMGLVLRVDAQPEPSSAATRWAISSASSFDPLGLPGRATLLAELQRQRGAGALGRWHLEWNHGTRAFTIPALSGAMAAPSFDRQDRARGEPGWARTG